MTRGPYVPLSVHYGDDDRVLEAGPLAELLFVRVLALAGRLLSDGFVSVRQLERLALDLRPLADPEVLVTQLVLVGLLREELEGTPPGYRVRSWLGWNSPAEEVRAAQEARRAADRERQARRRERLKSSEEVTASSRRDARDSHDTVPHESRASSTSSSSSSSGSSTTDLPPPLEPLRDACQRARLLARWDKLTGEQLDELQALVARHGVERLVKAAQAAHVPDKPAAYAQAWLGAWRELPDRARLRPVEQRCDLHLAELPCRGCAADAKAAG